VQLQLSRRWRLAADDVQAVADAKTRELFGGGLYRNSEQREGVYTLLRQQDAVTVLLVMPTARGNTATFLIPAAVEADAAVTVASGAAKAAAATVAGAAGHHPHHQHQRDGPWATPTSAGGVSVGGRNRGCGGGGGAGGCRGAAATAAAAAATAAAAVEEADAAEEVASIPAPWNPSVTIVLTPTRAVTANIRAVAAAAGLTVGNWPRGCDSGESSLLVIDMATIVRDSCISFALVQLPSAAGCLARVVIDEVHLAMLWSNFRAALLHIRSVLADLVCPLIFLSATVPVPWVGALIAAVGVRSTRPVAVLRAGSTRRTYIRSLVEQIVTPLSHGRTHEFPDGNSALHVAIVGRFIKQVDAVTTPGGDHVGRSAVLCVFCEQIAEVDGIVDELHAEVRRRRGVRVAPVEDDA